MLPLSCDFSKSEKCRCGARRQASYLPAFLRNSSHREKSCCCSRVRERDTMRVAHASFCTLEPALPSRERDEGEALSSRQKFQPFQPGRAAQAHLALHAERLQRDRIRRAADQHVAADTNADGRTALRAGVISRE